MNLLIGFKSIIIEVLATVSPLLLNLLYALVLLLIGFLIAVGLKWVAVTLLTAAQFEKGCKWIRFTDLLTKGGIKRSPTELVGDLFYWVIIFIAVSVIANLLGLTLAKVLLNNLLAYLPAVLSAAYILGIGIFVAVLLSNVILVIVNNIGLSNANTLAKIVQYAIIIFAFLAALGQLGILVGPVGPVLPIEPAKSVTSVTPVTPLIPVGPASPIGPVTVVVGAVGLALAIAFGLGAKDRAADFLNKFFS